MDRYFIAKEENEVLDRGWIAFHDTCKEADDFYETDECIVIEEEFSYDKVNIQGVVLKETLVEISYDDYNRLESLFIEDVEEEIVAEQERLLN